MAQTNTNRKKWPNNNPNYFREYRKNNPEKFKRSPEYWRETTRRWRLANPEEYNIQDRFNRKKRKARIKGARIGRIKRTEIWNWESKVCGICSSLIEGAYHLDHIIPLSKGGAHDTSNLQLAHPVCNMLKGSNMVLSDQQRLPADIKTR